MRLSTSLPLPPPPTTTTRDITQLPRGPLGQRQRFAAGARDRPEDAVEQQGDHEAGDERKQGQAAQPWAHHRIALELKLPQAPGKREVQHVPGTPFEG